VFIKFIEEHFKNMKIKNVEPIVIEVPG